MGSPAAFPFKDPEFDSDRLETHGLKFHVRKHEQVVLTQDFKEAQWKNIAGSADLKRWAFSNVTIEPIRSASLQVLETSPDSTAIGHFAFITRAMDDISDAQIAGTEPIEQFGDETKCLKVELQRGKRYSFLFGRISNTPKMYCNNNDQEENLDFKSIDNYSDGARRLMMRVNGNINLRFID